MDIENLPGEKWAQIDGFDGYFISDHGRFASERRGARRLRKLGVHRQGCRLAMFTGNIARHVHRLVAMAFIPNPQGFPVVHHKDANPSNNHVLNLQWTTQKENIRQAMLVRGNWLIGSPRSLKPITRVCPNTGERKRFPSVKAAAQWVDDATVANGGMRRHIFRCIAPNLCNARRGRRLTAYGFRWV